MKESTQQALGAVMALGAAVTPALIVICAFASCDQARPAAVSIVPKSPAICPVDLTWPNSSAFVPICFEV